MNFVYMNAHKYVSAFYVSNIKQNETYFSGYCEQKNRVLTFRFDRVIQEFDNFEKAKLFAENIPFEIFKKYDDIINLQKRELKKQAIIQPITFCFTGFDKNTKQNMQQLVKDLELRTVTNVSSKVDYLVVCEHSKTVGPSKLSKAEKFDVKVIYEDQFFYMIETGEIPE